MLDNSYDAEDIFGTEMVNLNHALCRASNPNRALDLIVQFLLKQVTRCSATHVFDQMMLGLWSNPDPQKVYKLAMDCGLSLRQFERISLYRLGMRPKLYGKIIRFSKAYGMVERDEYKNWTDLAYLNNYYDSRHLKKDFKNFTGKKLKILQNEIAVAPMLLQANLSLKD